MGIYVRWNDWRSHEDPEPAQSELLALQERKKVDIPLDWPVRCSISKASLRPLDDRITGPL
jgi:hypothetical protein